MMSHMILKIINNVMPLPFNGAQLYAFILKDHHRRASQRQLEFSHAPKSMLPLPGNRTQLPQSTCGYLKNTMPGIYRVSIALTIDMSPYDP